MKNQFSLLTGILAVIASVLPIAAQSSPPVYGNEQYSSNQPMDQGVAPNQVDPEDRNHGVARVSLLNGDVSVKRGDSGDFVAAALNAPLLALDAVQTGPSSRAEVQFDTANRLRFANNTEARFSQLTGDRAQIQLARGTLTWAVLADGGMQGEIATPSVAVRPLGRGDYRISVLPDGRTEITARSGTLEVYSPRGVERVQAGQTLLAQGGVDNPEFQTLAAVAPDEWDIFNERRDRELQGSRSYNYVSRDIAGAEDLDNYGQWNTDATYGQVWTPRVAEDWAPYRLGRWSYENYYGWTWVSGDPWGWAPYHYGSWFQSSYGWSWCPGSRYSHNYYRPALVAFFGYGSGGGYGGRGWGFGNVGWVPLAPFERYHPWYGRSANGYGAGGGRGANIANNVNITNSYRNARANNGVTSMNSRDFAGGNFGRYSSPGMSQLQQAGAVHGAMPFTPSANHYRFNDRQTTQQPRTNFNQTQFANRTQSSGTTLGGNRYVPQQQGVGSFGRQGSPQVNQGNQQYGGSSNWNRFGTPNAQGGQVLQQQNGGFGRQSQPAVSPAPATTPGNNGWQRFGDPGSSRQNYAPQRLNGSVGEYRPMTQQQQQFGRNNSPAVQISPPVVRDRNAGGQQNYNRPNYNQPVYNQPSYSQPSRVQPSYSQPQQSMSRPAYSQPQTESRPQSQPARQDSGQRQNSRPSSSGASSSHSDSGSHGRR